MGGGRQEERGEEQGRSFFCTGRGDLGEMGGERGDIEGERKGEKAGEEEEEKAL